MRRSARSENKRRSISEVTYSRTEALLAQLLLHSMSDAGQQRKALSLRAAGFSNVEIAQLMSTTADVIAQVLYIARRGQAKKTTAKPRKRARR